MTPALLESTPPADTAAETTQQQTLKVLHVVNGQHYAGAARVQDLLALALPKLGYQVSFACVLPDKFEDRRLSQQSPLYNFPMKHRLDFGPAHRIAELVRSENVDILHSHTTRSAMIAAAAARMSGIPYVHHVHCQMNTEVGRRLKSMINMAIERFTCGSADRVIAVSGSIEKFLLRNRFTKAPITVVPNGVPAGSTSKQRRSPNDPWVIGMVALLRERKGLESLMEALPQLREHFDARLRIVGPFESDEYRQQIMQRAEYLRIRPFIDWTGFTSDVNTEIVQMDVLVLPSVLPEGLPMVLLEAMSAGVPIVGSRVDGITDVITHEENGLLTDPANHQSLASELLRIMRGEVSWADLRTACQDTYQLKFSDTAMAVGVAGVYDEILAARKANQQ